MNNEMVAHAWAHGREAKGSNLKSLPSGVLMSYWTEIAYIIDGVAYISADNMSQITSGHISYARRAVSYQYFSTPAFSRGGGTPARTHAAMTQPAAARAVQELETCLSSNRRQKTKDAAICHYNQERVRIQEHAARHGVTVNMPVIDTSPEAIAAYQAEKAAAAKKLNDAKEKAIRIQQRKDKREYTAWLTEGVGRCPRAFQKYGEDQFTIKGDKVVTSQGAECPLDHAVKAIKFYLSRKNESGFFEEYQTNGHKVPLGIFTLDSISGAGDVKAGCHRFKAKEIARFIKQWREVLGL